MSEFENNFKLVKRLLSSRVPEDVADRIAHESLDKRAFLAMDHPIGALDAELKRPQKGREIAGAEMALKQRYTAPTQYDRDDANITAGADLD
jgi:hypothetical protein